MNKLIEIQINDHLHKIGILQREIQLKKSAGELKLLKQQMQLEHELGRIQKQIDSRKETIKQLQLSDSHNVP